MRSYLTVGVVVGAGLLAAPPVPSSPHAPPPAVRLVAGLGDGTALVMGPSGFPIPTPGYVAGADALYLAPLGFTGTPQALFTPEGLNPVTAVKSLPTDTSFAQGAQILDAAIQARIAAGGVDPANPVVVFGWSQSSSVASLTMAQLAGAGVPAGDVHFMLLGDPNNANGGVLERFDVPDGSSPSFPSLGITFNGATPAELYPTDVYTTEYDGFADFPQYPLNFVSDLNAFFGLLLAHGAYLGLTPEQIASAVSLPTSAPDGLTDYYMIPSQSLPLLELLELIPGVGRPLYDLLEPDTRILVNLGYGSIDNGWSAGDADVPTPFGLFPTNLNPADVLAALGAGLQRGISDAVTQLQAPGNFGATPIADIPGLATLLNETSALGFNSGDLHSVLGFTGFPTSDATLASPPTEIVNLLTGTLAADYATLLPVADTLTAITTGLPLYDADVFTEHLQSGDLLGAIGDPIAADTALVPFALLFGAAAPIGEAALGTAINLAGLFDA